MNTQYTFEVEAVNTPQNIYRLTLPFTRRRVQILQFNACAAQQAPRMWVKITATATADQARLIRAFIGKQTEIISCNYYQASRGRKAA